MEPPFTLWLQKIYKNVAAFGRPLPPAHPEGENAAGTASFPEWTQFNDAKEKTMKRSTIAKSFVISAVTALALVVAPAGQAACSNMALRASLHTKTPDF